MKYAEHKCLLTIESVEIYAGSMPVKPLKKAVAYVESHPEGLMNCGIYYKKSEMEAPEIIEIIAVEPYRVLSRWSNGEIRQNDYTTDVRNWRDSENALYRQLANWDNFRQVVVNDGILSWPSVRVVFDLDEGERSEPFEFDPITTYESSNLLVNTLFWGDSLGDTLAKARHQAKLSQDELARRIGSTKQYISKVERGLVQPQADTLQRIAAAMGRRVALV